MGDQQPGEPAPEPRALDRVPITRSPNTSHAAPDAKPAKITRGGATSKTVASMNRASAVT